MTRRLQLKAIPVYKGRDNSPWLTVCPPTVPAAKSLLGESVYTAQAGATTCGADGVFLLRALRKASSSTTLVENVHDAGRREVPKRQGVVKDEYLFPVCRGKDISRWEVRPELLVLMVQDPKVRVGIDEKVLKKHPATWEFVSGFKPQLIKRKSSMLPKDPFYSIYGVGMDTFAPFKAVWGRVSNTVSAAVVSAAQSAIGLKVVLPFEAMMVSFDHEDEAHFVCGVLNSAPAQLIIIGSVVLHPDTHVLRRINIPKFEPANRLHSNIVDLSRLCHQATQDHATKELEGYESNLSALCGQLWKLEPSDIERITRCLSQIEGHN